MLHVPCGGTAPSNDMASGAARPSAKRGGWRAASVASDCDDDGESAAGGRLLHLLTILDVKNVCVVVSRPDPARQPPAKCTRRATVSRTDMLGRFRRPRRASDTHTHARRALRA
jgi:hypothetical protein